MVYILKTDKNTLYTGYTNDLKKRLVKHKAGKGAKYMRCFGNFELVFTEELETKSEAMKREAKIKKMTKKMKEELIGGIINHESE